MALVNIAASQLITGGKHGTAIMLPSSLQSRLKSCEAHQRAGSAMNTVENPTCFANGSNTTYIESLFVKWLQNPFSVHKSWYKHFDSAMGKEDRSAAVINAAHIIDFFKRWSDEPDSIDLSWYWFFVSQAPPATKSIRLPNSSITATNVAIRQNIDEYMASAAEECLRESRLDSIKSKRISHLNPPYSKIAPDKRDTAKMQAMPLNSSVFDYFTSTVTRNVNRKKVLKTSHSNMSKSKKDSKDRSAKNIEKFVQHQLN